MAPIHELLNLIREIPMAGKPLVSGNPAGVIKLPEPRQDSRTSVEWALRRQRSVREFGKAGLTLAEISQLDDAEVKRVLTLAVNEEPMCLMPVGKPGS